MKDRFKDWEVAALPGDLAAQVSMPKSDAVKDAISALVSLGYKPQEASKMVSHVNSEGLSSEEVIRQALKSVAP